ncbi:MAG: 3-deoxy-manno-octulosonate cytidylyltransferase [Acidiferrobacterales bacterium]
MLMRIIIPVRYDSTRLPGKPLCDVGGKPLIQRVYECGVATGADEIIIATDDERIKVAATGFGARVCMTARSHRSGTERIAEVVHTLSLSEDEVIVNLQGDEPLMPAVLIKSVADTLIAHPAASVATAMHTISDYETFRSPNAVKVVCNKEGYALYFSRAPIPRSATGTAADRLDKAYRHIGLYAYRAGFITRYASWTPAPLEELEALEQLRVLWHGARIVVFETTEEPGPGIDTPKDLERVRAIFASRES